MRIAVATLALLVAASPAVAAPRADLAPTRVSIGAGSVVAGAKVVLGDTVKNRGGRTARASTVAYYLSSDRRKSAADFWVAGRKLHALRAHRSSSGRVTATIPPSLVPGNWYVIVCADSRHAVRESNERNNCRAAPTYLVVRGDTPTGGGQSGGSPAAGPPSGGSGAPGGSNPSPPVVSGCQIFPADNPWNRDISQDPVDPLSATYIKYMGSSPGADWTLRQDWGTGSEPYYGIPWVVVPATQALLPISFSSDGAPDESDPGPYPFPPDIPIEGGSPTDPDPTSGDRHAIALQQGSPCTLYETSYTMRQHAGDGSVNGFQVYAGAKFDLGSNQTRPATWTSADAAGLPMFPGLAKYQEVASGAVTHALRFTVPLVQKSWVAPATHYGTQANACYPPYGARLRLKASFDLSGFSGQALVIAQALKKYGLILADQGSAGYISGTSDDGWDIDNLKELRQIHGSDLEVVATGPITHYNWTPPVSPSC